MCCQWTDQVYKEDTSTKSAIYCTTMLGNDSDRFFFMLSSVILNRPQLVTIHATLNKRYMTNFLSIQHFYTVIYNNNIKSAQSIEMPVSVLVIHSY